MSGSQSSRDIAYDPDGWRTGDVLGLRRSEIDTAVTDSRMADTKAWNIDPSLSELAGSVIQSQSSAIARCVAEDREAYPKIMGGCIPHRNYAPKKRNPFSGAAFWREILDFRTVRPSGFWCTRLLAHQHWC